ncbi:DUF4149 domain-containing protein [Rubrivivax albus]|uniref:DUF4149 domain-containing protein n=1 Tax=Rubrivivax albus TaxID=2499835 RepID=A0A3S2X016_9BURK|nr:DUF4149 domain-containing protein [Rubrivivax albus]RVT50427.1 DUF4149 domain-containing protein [Rubrivivax albus]
MAERLRRLLPGLWAGFLLCVAAVATPAAFALLQRPDAGRMVARILGQEAYVSLALALLLLMLERIAARDDAEAGRGSQFSVGMGLAAGALFCTVAGYFGVQPMMDAARAGQGSLSFGQLHAISSAFYGVKLLLVLALAWRAARPPVSPASSS